MKALVFRPGLALGDGCWITPIPRLLANKGYEVHLAIDDHLKPIFANNQYISDYVRLPEAIKWHEWEEKYEEVVNEYDKLFHTHGHVEVGLMYRTDTKWGSVPTAPQRRKNAKGKNYQDVIFKDSGVCKKSYLPEFYFTDEEKKDAKRLRRMLDKDKKKLIIWQWDGSSRSKTLSWGPKYFEETLKKYPDTIHYIFTWDANLNAQIPEDSRVFRAAGKVSVRQSIILTSVADLVIGPESFLINAAAAFETPKIVFFSHSAPENLTKHFKNCHNIVPTKEASCHPCYLIPADFQKVFDPVRRGISREFEKNCLVWNEEYRYESYGYKCCYFLPHDTVMATIEIVLKDSHWRRP